MMTGLNDSAVPRSVLRCAARFIPASRRPEWFAEWSSELWYVAASKERGQWEVLRYTLGAFRDALWVWRESSGERSAVWLESPLSSIAFLLCAAALSVVLFACKFPQGNATTVLLYGDSDPFALRQAFLVLAALVLLPAVTSFGAGSIQNGGQAGAIRARWRRRAFAVLKTALVIGIVFFGAFDVAPLALQPHAALTGYVLGFRWILLDQRRRCPICLRLLHTPSRIGQASRTFLARYGTELCCDRGHGLMYAPAALTSYTAPCWSEWNPPGVSAPVA